MKLIELTGGHSQTEPIAKLYLGERAQVMELRLPSGGVIPAHRHDGDEVVLFPEEGTCRLNVDSEAVVLCPGKLFCSDGAHEFVLSNEGQGEFRALAILIQSELPRVGKPSVIPLSS